MPKQNCTATVLRLVIDNQSKAQTAAHHIIDASFELEALRDAVQRMKNAGTLAEAKKEARAMLALIQSSIEHTGEALELMV